MRKISNPSKKIECAKICFAEVSKCAKRIENAMAKCGVKFSGDDNDPAGTIVFNLFSVAVPENEKASTYTPTKDQIIDLASFFQKTYRRKKK